MKKLITTNEIDFYKRNVEYFIENLDFKNGTYKSKNIEIEITPDLQIPKLKITGILPELTAEIKTAITQALSHLMRNFEQFKDYSINRSKLADDLEITLMDYVEFVLKKNLNNLEH